MSNALSLDINGDKTKSAEKQDVAVSLSYAKFLETVPPGDFRTVKLTNPISSNSANGNFSTLPSGDIMLHCNDKECKGPRKFACTSGNRHNTWARYYSDDFQIYTCRNCNRKAKRFALRHILKVGDDAVGYLEIMKYGEYPRFGPPNPERLLKLIEADADTFRKGRDCENQGLGIGAFSYYRRVVDNQKIKIFEHVIAAATKLNASPELLAELEQAKNEPQFKRSVEILTKALPDMLQMEGQNPLKLLYGALSEGLHGWDDETCLSRAASIRIILAELADTVAAALKQKSELSNAVADLLKARDPGNGKGT